MAKAHIHLHNGKIIECTGAGKAIDNDRVFKDLAKKGIPKSAVKKIVHKIEG